MMKLFILTLKCSILAVCFASGVIYKCTDIDTGIKFAKSNGLHFLSIFTKNMGLMIQCGFKAWKTLSQTDGIFARVTLKVGAPTTLFHQDSFLVLFTGEDLFDKEIMETYLSFAAQKERLRCIMSLIGTSDEQTYDEQEILASFVNYANSSNKNLMFYLNMGRHWHTVVKVKNTERAILQKINVTNELRVGTIAWDLQGLHLIDVSGGNIQNVLLSFSGKSKEK